MIFRMPQVPHVVVVLTVMVVVVDSVTVIEVVPVLVDEAEVVELVVWRVVVVLLVVGPVDETAVELEVPEVGTEDVDEAVGLGTEEEVMVPFVVVVTLSLVAASGKRVTTPRARTKATTTATVAPAAICLLYSDNRGLLGAQSI